MQRCGSDDRGKKITYSDRNYVGSLFCSEIPAALCDSFFYCVFSGASSESSDREDPEKAAVEERNHCLGTAGLSAGFVHLLFLLSVLYADGSDPQGGPEF